MYIMLFLLDIKFQKMEITHEVTNCKCATKLSSNHNSGSVPNIILSFDLFSLFLN